jgi:hypothetical protein
MLPGEKIFESGRIWMWWREQIQGAKEPSESWQPSGVQP